jgi:predicted MFS family arabinose efflux permease
VVAAAILLDAGTIGDQALGRRAVNLLRPEARGRINALFTGIFFIGGAIGAAIAGVAWARAGWNGVCFVAMAFVAAPVATHIGHKTATTWLAGRASVSRP